MNAQVRTHRIPRRFKPKLFIRITRNGNKVFEFKKKRDLLVWRGQMVLAYLISQGAKGTATSSWKAVASENQTLPDMGDDSGNPLENEFNPLIGSPVNVSYDFIPDVKPSGGYQTMAELIIEATVTSDGSKTLRKVGVIDTVATPNQHIIFEDAVIPYNVVLNDQIYIRYTIPLG